MLAGIKGMRIGVLASSGGSAFIETWKILTKYSRYQHEYFVITDRACDIESFCEKYKILHQRIEYKKRQQFSIDSFNYIQKNAGADVIFLYFLRILTADLFTQYPCLNIHPALLPAFRGLNAVEQFIKSGAKFMGSTLHLVDDGIDTGKIIAQIQTPMNLKTTLEKANKISFLQKVYITLLGIELFENGSITLNEDHSNCMLADDLPYLLFANPALQHPGFIQGFQELQEQEDTYIF